MPQKTEEQHDFLSLYEKIKADFKGYLANKLSWIKLSAYEKIALAGSHFGYILGLLILCLAIFFLGIIALGLFLGEWLGSYAMGFGLMVLIVLGVLLLSVLLAKPIRRLISNMVVSVINKVESNEE